jgi:hypothetical protein
VQGEGKGCTWTLIYAGELENEGASWPQRVCMFGLGDICNISEVVACSPLKEMNIGGFLDATFSAFLGQHLYN